MSQFSSDQTWFFNIKADVWTQGPSLVEGRRGLSCAVDGTNVIVAGGYLSTLNSMEIWNHERGTDGWSKFSVSIGPNDAKLLFSGKNLYLFGGWELYDVDTENEDYYFGSNIWKIDDNFEFHKVGNMSDRKYAFTAFTIPRGYLTKCQGMQMLKFKEEK